MATRKKRFDRLNQALGRSSKSSSVSHEAYQMLVEMYFDLEDEKDKEGIELDRARHELEMTKMKLNLAKKNISILEDVVEKTVERQATMERKQAMMNRKTKELEARMQEALKVSDDTFKTFRAQLDEANYRLKKATAIFDALQEPPLAKPGELVDAVRGLPLAKPLFPVPPLAKTRIELVDSLLASKTQAECISALKEIQTVVVVRPSLFDAEEFEAVCKDLRNKRDLRNKLQFVWPGKVYLETLKAIKK